MTTQMEQGDPVWYEIQPGLTRRAEVEELGPFEHSDQKFNEECVKLRDYKNERIYVRKIEDVEPAEEV